MRPSPVRLEHYNFAGLSIVPIEGYEPDLESDNPYPKFANADFSIHVRIAEPSPDESHQKFLLHLDLKGEPKKDLPFPYQFSIGADAIISLRGKVESKNIRNLVSVNGASMLYSALREALLSLTYRFPNGPMMLPSASFIDLEENAKVRSAESETTSASPTRKRRKKTSA